MMITPRFVLDEDLPSIVAAFVLDGDAVVIVNPTRGCPQTRLDAIGIALAELAGRADALAVA